MEGEGGYSSSTVSRCSHTQSRDANMHSSPPDCPRAHPAHRGPAIGLGEEQDRTAANHSLILICDMRSSIALLSSSLLEVASDDLSSYSYPSLSSSSSTGARWCSRRWMPVLPVVARPPAVLTLGAGSRSPVVAVVVVVLLVCCCCGPCPPSSTPAPASLVVVVLPAPRALVLLPLSCCCCWDKRPPLRRR